MKKQGDPKVNDEYIEHYLQIDRVFPSVLALKLFLGNNPSFSFRNIPLKDKLILDIGFGDGRDLHLFNLLGMKVHGVEVDQKVVEHAKSKFEKLGIDLSLKTGTNNNTGFPDDTFDIVYSSAAIYYLGDETQRIQDALKHCSNILKPGGFFVGSVARHDCHTTKGALKLDANRYILEDPYYKVRKGQYYHVYNSNEEVREDLSNCGFEVVCVTDYDVDWFGTRETLYLFVAKKA